MTREPRRHFFQARNEIHYNKEKKMGGPIYQEFVRGEVPLTHTVQETIDSLNAAIDRLDKIINEMQENCQCKN